MKRSILDMPWPPVSRLDKVAELFKARPNTWIGGRRLAHAGGYAAFRTRISECRTKRCMRIENRVSRRLYDETETEYRYVPEED